MVESVGTEAASALKAGDHLVVWQVFGSEKLHDFELWSDAELLDFEATPRGPIRVRLTRDGVSRTEELPALELKVAGRPPISEERVAMVHSILADPTDEGAAQKAVRAVEGLPGSTGSWALTRLAEARMEAGDLPGAAATYEAAAEAHRGSFAGELLRRAGEALRRTGDLDAAEDLFQRARSIWELHQPGGLGGSAVLVSLGGLQARRHDFDSARNTLQRACETRQRLAPGSWLLAGCVNSQGVMHGRAGDLAMAEARFLEALEIRRNLGDSGKEMLSNLGVVARLRGDLERARLYAEQALAIDRERGEPLEIADRLENLGNVLLDQGRLREAVTRYSEALELLEEANPAGSDLGHVLYNRGKAYRLLEEVDLAKADLRRARELYGFDVPRDPLEASVTQMEGEVAYLEGDLELAIVKLAQGLDVQARFRPDSAYEALAAAALADAFAARGSSEQANTAYRRAIRALERQQERIGGGDRGLVAFRTKYSGIYRRYQEFLLATGQKEAAFELYERSRAQGLRVLLAGRDLAWDSGPLAELAPERERLGRKIETKYRELSELEQGSTSQRDGLREEIERLHAERDALSARIYEASPRMRRLEVPPALGLKEIVSRLPGDTLVLAYSVGERSTTLFTLETTDGLGIHSIAETREVLSRNVERWSELVTSPRARAEASVRARELGELLLGPVADQLRRARTVVVVPDGPLHSLPFAAVPVPGTARARYLVETLPVQRAPSVSVYLSDVGSESPHEPRRILVVGDPATPEEALARYRRELGGLPAARAEAEAVRRQFGERSRVLLGADATEDATRRELPAADLAHFACHAIVDEALPMDSALVLSPTGETTGLLHAWEIVEDLELDADLVVLSACQTARGGERAGEGIVGLVRSLQIAGARNVVATLWNVADESTAVLMERFYRYLAGGEAPPSALRRAQLDLIRGPVETEREGRTVTLRLDSPRHWAPFVLVGVAE